MEALLRIFEIGLRIFERMARNSPAAIGSIAPTFPGVADAAGVGDILGMRAGVGAVLAYGWTGSDTLLNYSIPYILTGSMYVSLIGLAAAFVWVFWSCCRDICLPDDIRGVVIGWWVVALIGLAISFYFGHRAIALPLYYGWLEPLSMWGGVGLHVVLMLLYCVPLVLTSWIFARRTCASAPLWGRWYSIYVHGRVFDGLRKAS